MTEPTSAETSAATHSIRRSLSRIALEIVIGFVGVYAAFALTAYKERRDVVDRRHQIKRALIAEIKDIADHERNDATLAKRQLAVFDSSVKVGRPIVRKFTEAVDQQGHVWEATKSAGALNIIDVPTFIAMSKFYNDNSNMYAQYNQLRDLSMRELIPRMYLPPEALIDPATKRVIPPLVVYRSGVSRFAGFADLLAREGDLLVVRLAADTI